MRRCATMRRPAASRQALILPVRFRRVASGLMIDSVRSVAICLLLVVGDVGRLTRRFGGGGQGWARSADWRGWLWLGSQLPWFVRRGLCEGQEIGTAEHAEYAEGSGALLGRTMRH